MPLKTCPKCDAKHGPRKKLCECGHDFTSKISHPLVPEPGGWVLDDLKGMPTIEQPEPLPRGQLTREQVEAEVSYSGLGFCVYSLIPVNRIKDRKLRGLWVKARAAMQKVVEELYE
jgi:hypothetical protein